MKQYIKPEIKISMFDVECVSADANVPAVLSQPAYGNNLDAFIRKNQSTTVQKNLDFNKAIEFN